MEKLFPPTTANQTPSPTTTGHPTFKNAQPADPTSSPVRTSGQYTGTAYSNPEMCRSEWGYWGIGISWCNSESLWKASGCGTNGGTTTKSPMSGAVTNSPTKKIFNQLYSIVHFLKQMLVMQKSLK